MTKGSKKIIIGYTRFSVYLEQSKHWVISQKTNYLSQIFDTNRLDARFDIFFNHTIPALELAKKDLNDEIYLHFVFYSSAMPIKDKERLFMLAKNYNFLVLVEVSSQLESYSYIDYIGEFLLKNDEYKNDEYKDLVGIFSVDDDDILSTQYFRHIKHYLSESFIGMRVSFPEGLTGYYENKIFSSIRKVNFPKINIGIFTIGEITSKGLILPPLGNHMHLDKKSPVILDSRVPMFFWTKHDKQDTNSKEKFNIQAMEIYPILYEEDFPLKIFPTIAKKQRSFKKIHDVNNFKIFTKKELILEMSNTYIEYFFEIELECSSLEDKSVLLVVEPTIGNNHVDMADSGLYKSSSKDIGYFRYLTSGKKITQSQFIIKLPLDISAVKIYLYNYKSIDFLVRNFKISAC